MPLQYQDIQELALKEIESSVTTDVLEEIRVRYVGRSGVVTDLISKISILPADQRPEAGKALNVLKKKIIEALQAQQEILSKKEHLDEAVSVDVSLPGVSQAIGSIHPITQVMGEACRIFSSLGFRLFEGPEIETEYNNFEALNIPLNHPSCDAFDTFYLNTSSGKTVKKRQLLRSHTSPGQIRVMKQYEPPIAAIVPGKVYRPDATDASHSTMFHQVEGFLVDKDVRFSDLKGILEYFSKQMFGSKTRIRFRPHFFPFTEPSAEVDVSCIICEGRGKVSAQAKACSVCKGTGWLEVLGCGMIHPNVFKAVGYKKGEWSGFAFGMGVERIAMLRYGINDIRIFFENDIRFLKQFQNSDI